VQRLTDLKCCALGTIGIGGITAKVVAGGIFSEKGNVMVVADLERHKIAG
jgi:hypothetical protein